MSVAHWSAVRRVARNLHTELLAASESPRPTGLLNAALQKIGFTCHLLPPGDALLSGALGVLEPEARIIWLRNDLPESESLLVRAHELAHFHLHHQFGEAADTSCQEDDLEIGGAAGVDAIVGYGPRQRREAEANVFAREFLLPAPFVRLCFYDDGLTAPEIAERFGAPLTLVYAQLADSLAPDGYEPDAPAFPPLDGTQEEAVRVRHGASLILAGPGTGKTHTLAARALYLTEQGVPPENILALTFSRRAADEMRERIARQNPAVARRMAISTFHSYGLDLLRGYWQAAGLPPKPVLLDPAEVYALLERHITDVPLDALRYLHDPAFPLDHIRREIERAKEVRISPAEYAERAARNPNWKDDPLPDKHRETALVYALYEKLLNERGAIDFTDLVVRALAVLEQPEVLLAERARWQHLLVDEYQDINPAGAALIRLLAGDGAGLWMVGDARQTIYSFRGASPVALERFRADFPTGQFLPLGVNYRSRPALVSLFGTVCGEGEAHWQAMRDGDGTVTLAVAPNERAQQAGIVRKIREFLQSGYAPHEIALLYRTQKQAQEMRESLRAQEIPVEKDAEENDLLQSADVRHLLLLLCAAVEPEGAAAMHLQEQSQPIFDLPTYGDAFAMLAHLLWGTPGLARTIHDFTGISRLLALARAFRDRAALRKEPNRELATTEFLTHLRRLARQGGTLPVAEVGRTDGVRILTVHGAKGLQFSVVFVPNLSDGKFPSRPATTMIPTLVPGADDEDEEERLFFVALTRARDHVIVSRAERYNNRRAKPSPLLTVLAGFPELIRETWDTEESAALDETGEEIVVELAEGFTDGNAAHEMPETVALEAWEAELYNRCPRRYYYERVRGYPAGSGSPYERFKRAVRHALKSPTPLAALQEQWEADGMDTLPHALFYHSAAEEIIAKNGGTLTGSRTFAIRRGAGTIHGRAETDLTGTRWEYRRFGKPPANEKADSEPRISLLMEAADQQSITTSGSGDSDGTIPTEPVTVSTHYLQNGLRVPAEVTPKQREKHLVEYDRALTGVRLRVFPASPEKAEDCPICPYYFVCPE